MFKRLLSTRLNSFLTPDYAILILRIGAAALMLTHGYPKLMQLLDGNLTMLGDPVGLGPELSMILVVLAEFLCAALVLVGFGTRIALIPLIINMTIITFIVHGDDPFGRKELPLFFLTSWVTLFLTGPGKISLDHLSFK